MGKAVELGWVGAGLGRPPCGSLGCLWSSPTSRDAGPRQQKTRWLPSAEERASMATLGWGFAVRIILITPEPPCSALRSRCSSPVLVLPSLQTSQECPVPAGAEGSGASRGRSRRPGRGLGEGVLWMDSSVMGKRGLGGTEPILKFRLSLDSACRQREIRN